MNIESINLVYFSPTGTTKKVLQAIAQGIGNKNVKLTDITKPGNREKVLQPSENELLIVGVPVYMGRVPALIGDWLNQIKANKTPVVCVAVYGNREFEDALLELKNTCNTTVDVCQLQVPHLSANIHFPVRSCPLLQTALIWTI